MFHAILFDFDGTLAPNLDLPGLRKRVTAFSRNCGVPDTVIKGRYIVEQITAGRDHLAGRDVGFANRYFDTAHALIHDFERTAAEQTELFPGMPAALDGLRHTGFKLGIVTRNSNRALNAMCPHLDRWFNAIRCREDVPHIKPDPRHLSHTLDVLQTHPNNAVMVGDGAMDMQSGKALDMYCVGVLSGSNGASELKAAGADAVIDSAIGLHDHLQTVQRV